MSQHSDNRFYPSGNHDFDAQAVAGLADFDNLYHVMGWSVDARIGQMGSWTIVITDSDGVKAEMEFVADTFVRFEIKEGLYRIYEKYSARHTPPSF